MKLSLLSRKDRTWSHPNVWCSSSRIHVQSNYIHLLYNATIPARFHVKSIYKLQINCRHSNLENQSYEHLIKLVVRRKKKIPGIKLDSDSNENEFFFITLEGASRPTKKHAFSTMKYLVKWSTMSMASTYIRLCNNDCPKQKFKYYPFSVIKFNEGPPQKNFMMPYSYGHYL